MLKLIESFLKASVMDELVESEPESGTPQGGVISPLLANIYLNDLDWKMERENLLMTRYADDMVILCQSAEEAERALAIVREWMKQAGLVLHPEKTKIVDMHPNGSYFDFLGYRFQRSRRGKLNRLVRPKSMKKLREKIHQHTRRCNRHSMDEIVEIINPIVKGWFGYFKQASHWVHEEVDGHIRQRLRRILRKRHGRARGQRSIEDNKRWNNSYFTRLGLFCLEEARKRVKLQSP